MAPYYGDAPNAFSGGRMFAGDVRARRYKENALNALIQRFGPEAADPVSLSQMQANEQNAILNPIEAAEAQRVGAARADLVGRRGVTYGDPGVVTADQGADDRVNAERMRAATGAASFLKSTQARGGDVVAAFDRLLPVLPQLGIPAESLGAMREQIANDPNSVKDFVAMLQGEDTNVRAVGNPQPVIKNGRLINRTYMTDGTFIDQDDATPANAYFAGERVGQGNARLGLADRRLTLDQQKAMGFEAPSGFQLEWSGEPGMSDIVARPIPGSQQELTMAETARGAEAEITEGITTLRGMEPIATSALGWLRDALTKIKANDWDPGVVDQNSRRAQAAITGTKTNAIQSNLTKASSNTGLTMLNAMPVSMMPVSNTDIALLQASLGDLNVSREPAQLQKDIENAISVYERMLTRSREIITEREAALQRARSRSAPRASTQNMDELSDEELARILAGGN